MPVCGTVETVAGEGLGCLRFVHTLVKGHHRSRDRSVDLSGGGGGVRVELLVFVAPGAGARSSNGRYVAGLGVIGACPNGNTLETEVCPSHSKRTASKSWKRLITSLV